MIGAFLKAALCLVLLASVAIGNEKKPEASLQELLNAPESLSNVVVIHELSTVLQGKRLTVDGRGHASVKFFLNSGGTHDVLAPVCKGTVSQDTVLRLLRLLADSHLSESPNSVQFLRVGEELHTIIVTAHGTSVLKKMTVSDNLHPVPPEFLALESALVGMESQVLRATPCRMPSAM